jgi:Domain of unknown function (DUF4412)
MKPRSLFISFVLFLAVASFASGQVGGSLRSKVNRAVDVGARAADKAINREVDTAVTKAVNNEAAKIEKEAEENKAEQQQEKEADKQAGGQKGGGFNLGALMGGPVTSKYRESYSFNHRIFMQGEIYDGKDVVKMDYFIYFSDSSPDAGIESKMSGTTDEGKQVGLSSSFIYDGTNRSFMMLTDMGGTKLGFISDVPQETTTVTETNSGSTITKTGNSRVIAGYKCDEYLVKEESTKEYSRVWLTKDLKIRADKRTFANAGLSPYYDNPELRDAVTLAIESYDESGKPAMKSEAREINLNFRHEMSPAGFPLRQMNFDQVGAQTK